MFVMYSHGKNKELASVPYTALGLSLEVLSNTLASTCLPFVESFQFTSTLVRVQG